jgi:hypothetical protein
LRTNPIVKNPASSGKRSRAAPSFMCLVPGTGARSGIEASSVRETALPPVFWTWMNTNRCSRETITASS